jgi:hypothetical protein
VRRSAASRAGGHSLVRVEVGLRIRPPPHVDRDRRLDVHARVTAAQPPLPPRDHDRHVVDPRARHREAGTHVAPGPEQDLLRPPQPLEGTERHVPVAVGVARDHEGRGLDRVVVEEDRRAPPVVVLVLVLEPLDLPGLVRSDPAEPFFAPSLAEHGRDRGQGIEGHHVRGVVEEVDPAPRASAVVDVVGVAAIRRVDRDDRFEGGRTERGNLQRVEPGIGGPVHPHVAVGPVLVSQPFDRRHVILELPIRVLVFCDAFGRSRAAHVGAADCEPALVAQTPVDRGRVGEVVLAVRTGLEDHRPRRRRFRHVEGDGDPHPVVHLDEASLVGHRRARYNLQPSGA